MLRAQCPNCSKEIRAADAQAGKRVRCPDCKEVLTLPDASTAVQSPPERPNAAKSAVSAAPPKRRPDDEEEAAPMVVPVDDDDDDDRERRRKRRRRDDDDDDDDDDRPRRRRRRRRGPYADCPNCGARGDATKVTFTWWGGIVGPALFSHVQCNECGAGYNGKTGKSNNTAIAIYVGVGVVFGLAIGFVGCMAVVGSHFLK